MALNSTLLAILLASSLSAPLTPIVPSAGQQQAPAPGQTRVGPVPTDPWPAWPPPPIYRSNPRGYTVGLSINVGSLGDGINGPLLASAGGDVTISAIVADNFTVSDLRHLQVNGGVLGIAGSEAGRFRGSWALEGPEDADVRRIVQKVPAGRYNGLVTRVEWPAIAFSSSIDEAAASRLTWPRRWSPEAALFLGPSEFIPSDSEVFKAFVNRLAGDQLRRTPVYLAAKDLVRKTILEFRNVDGVTMVQEEEGRIRGYRLNGAIRATQMLSATPGDLVCVSVAVLRAAGIPARPVIGIDSGKGTKTKSKLPRDRTSMCVWAEFRLPGVGWVPFDPWQMRGQGLANKDIRRPWRWFGTIRDQNRRVAIAYDFAPFAHGSVPDWPAGWSWQLGVNMNERLTFNSVVMPILISRGPVKP